MKLGKDTQEVLKTTLYNLWLAARGFIETGTQHPALLLCLEHGTVHVVKLDEFTGDKDLLNIVIKAHQERPETDGTILVIEAWMAKATEEEVEKIHNNEQVIPPSQRADKKEVLMFVVETRMGTTVAYADITRNPDKLHPLQMMPSDKFEGRLVGGMNKPN